MEPGVLIGIVLIVLYFYLTYKMFDHIALNRPKDRWSWIFLWIFVGPFAVFWYYFTHIIPENRQKKIVGNKTQSIDSEINQKIESEIQVVKSKSRKKEKLVELILFVGGSFIFIISLTGGFYNSSGSGLIGRYSGSGFKAWSVIGMGIGVCMIVFGFLRRSWSKKP